MIIDVRSIAINQQFVLCILSGEVLHAKVRKLRFFISCSLQLVEEWMIFILPGSGWGSSIYSRVSSGFLYGRIL